VDAKTFAEQERAAAVHCAEELRRANLPCPVVSVGATLFGWGKPKA